MVYSGHVRDEEEVKKDLESIGPEVIQTLSVSVEKMNCWGQTNKYCGSVYTFFSNRT